MRYSTLQAPKAWSHYLSVFFFSFSLLFGPLLHAQTPPVNAWFTPGEFESGDKLTLHVDYGSAAIPVPAATQIELTFAYEGFDIVSSIDADVSDSWFCADGNCDATITADNETREIKVVVTRTDGHAVGGYGAFARGKGIIVEMDEIQMKKEQALIVFLPHKSRLDLSAPVKITYDRNYESIRIIGTYPESGAELSVMNSDGKLIFKKVGEITALTPVDLQKNKLLFVRLATQNGTYVTKLWLK
ncbi:MAG: hypothetical protein AAF927_04560 [Bacteroidota bacterium]